MKNTAGNGYAEGEISVHRIDNQFIPESILKDFLNTGYGWKKRPEIQENFSQSVSGCEICSKKCAKFSVYLFFIF
jgi:hypothetical protein